MLKIFRQLKDNYKINKTKKSGVMINPIRDELLKVYEYYKNKSIVEDTFYILGSKTFEREINKSSNLESLKDYLVPIYKEWDEEEKIPLILGEYLEEKVNDKKTVLGIHRSNSIIDSNTLNDEVLNNIMNEGLINNGDIMQGVISNDIINPSKTVSPCTSLLDTIIMIKSSYKESNGGVLIEFPNKYVNDDLDLKDSSYANNIYDIKNGIFYIKPEFILGFIKRDKEKIDYYPRDYILENSKREEKR